MKKLIACLLEMIAALAVLAAAACAVVAYWDRITELLAGLRERFCPCCGVRFGDDFDEDEFDDFID